MKEWPLLTETGDLPTGIHRATLTEVLERFGQSSPRRMVLGRRIRHIYELVQQTSCLARLILYGSFITNKLEPNDVITQFNSQAIVNLDQFKEDYQKFRKDKPKEALVLVVLRSDQSTQTIRIEPPQQ